MSSPKAHYWMISYGGNTRGPSGKYTTPAEECKRSFGMVAPNMLALDLGTRIVNVQNDKRRREVMNNPENWKRMTIYGVTRMIY